MQTIAIRWEGEKKNLQENEWSTGKANMKQLPIYPVYVGWHDENSFGFFFSFMHTK